MFRPFKIYTLRPINIYWKTRLYVSHYKSNLGHRIFFLPVRNAKLRMSMEHITMLFECLHPNCNLIPLMKHNLLFTRQHFILMREHVCKESDIPVTTSIINQWKLIDRVRVRNKKSKTWDFKVRQKILKEERSKTQDAFVRVETIQYKYGGFNENIGKKTTLACEFWVTIFILQTSL